MAKTIAQMMIRKWITNHFNCQDINIEFIGQREAVVTDVNGDQLSIRYDSTMREVVINDIF